MQRNVELAMNLTVFSQLLPHADFKRSSTFTQMYACSAVSYYFYCTKLVQYYELTVCVHRCIAGLRSTHHNWKAIQTTASWMSSTSSRSNCSAK